MYISQRSILVLLSILIKDTLCSNCNNNNGWPVAEFCKSGQFTGSNLVFDGYGFHADKEAKEPCSCTAVVSISNGGSSRLVFNRLSALQPDYKGCGSSITISDSDDTIVQRCFIGGTMPVKDRESISVKLSKDNPPEDTRYCMVMSVEDATASLSVTCSGGSPEDPQISTTTLSPLTSTEEVITAIFLTSTHSSSITDGRTKLSTIYSTLDKYTSTYLPTPSAADETIITLSSELKTQSSTSETTQPSTSQSTRFPATETSQTITTLLPTIETTASPTLDTTSSSTSTLDTTPSSTLGKTTFSLDTKTSSTLQSTRSSTSETTQTLISKITSTVKTSLSTLESTSSSIRDTTPSSTLLSTNPYVQTKTQTSTLSTTIIATDAFTSVPKTVSSQRETTSDSEATTESEVFRTTTSTENDKTNKSTSVTPTNVQSTKLVSKITSPQSTRITVTSGQTRDTTIDTSTMGNITTADKPSQDKNVPVEVIIPLAVVGGLLIVIIVICILCGLRSKACVCNDELVPSTNKLVHQTSEEIKNREKDTYVNPLYDDISLTGKSDRSDRDSMMQEIPSDEDEDYRIPSSTEIDGELWTHL